MHYAVSGRSHRKDIDVTEASATHPRMRASDFDPHILEIFDGYVHGKLSKREFIRQAGRYAAAGVTGLMIYNQLRPDYALAQQVAPDDPAIETMRIEYPSPEGHGTVRGLMARPRAATGRLPAVLVVHENRGLNPYIEDVVRRLAKSGYLALGPDGLTSLGGYPGTDDEGRTLQASLDPAKLMEDFFAGFEYLRHHKGSTGKVGVTGFCYGGGVCHALAVAYPDLGAAAPFYGRQAQPDQVPQIKAPLLIHFAENDERVNATWPACEAALKAHDKVYTAHFYPGTSHGFHNDTTPRFDAAAAALAWDRTLAFFKTHLAG